MDNITKFLLKLSLRERRLILEILENILSLDLRNLDVKKLQWKKNLFRVRKWKIRIIFKKDSWIWTIININYRNKVYKSL